MRLIALILAVVAVACAFMLSRPRPKPVDVNAVIASVTHPSDALLAPTASSPSPARAAVEPEAEPDEATLRRLVEAEYAEIERQGGMTLVVTANGQSVHTRPKVWTVRKESCRELGRHSGSWECGVALTVTLREGDNNPSPLAERVYVKRGPKGDWVAG